MGRRNTIVIWRLLDGKPGHENQSLGLVKAIQNYMACQYYDIEVKGGMKAVCNVITGHWPGGHDLPIPDLIIGAGHRTHWDMLAAKRAYGGKSIVLMRPSVPLTWFDLCLMPQHDHYKGPGFFVETQGVLNPFHASGPHHHDKALIMIGGPSKHYQWDTLGLLTQIRQLLAHRPWVKHTLTTSRRTPADFTLSLNSLSAHNLKVVSYCDTGPGWVANELAHSGTAWISEDSVSMVYEALTAHVSVGILNLDIKKENRISRGLENLIVNNMVVRFDSNAKYQQFLRPVMGFSEAERCAKLIVEKWFYSDYAIHSAILLGAE